MRVYEMKQQKPLPKALSVALVALTSFWFHHVVHVVRAQETQPKTGSPTANTQARLIVQLGHGAGVRSVAFSPEGKYVLTAFEGHSKPVRSAALSPDGKFVVTGSDDNTGRLWDTDTGKEVRRFNGHLNSVMSVKFSADGKSVLTGSCDRTARL